MGQPVGTSWSLWAAHPKAARMGLPCQARVVTWDALTSREADRIVELLEQNLREEPDRESNLRLWVQGVRRATTPPSVERVIERVTYWRANSDSLDAVFYLYVMHALLCIEGFVTARDAVTRFIEESRQKARIRRNRTASS